MTLNRPEVLNALNMSMIVAMHRQLRDWAANEQVRVVVVKGAGSRAFCAGGDVRAVFDARGNDAFMDRIYRVEYQLDDYISRYPKPYIALMSGITMGGGCGISIHGRHRVVTESSVIAMPEVAIGLFPILRPRTFWRAVPARPGSTSALPALASVAATPSTLAWPITCSAAQASSGSSHCSRMGASTTSRSNGWQFLRTLARSNAFDRKLTLALVENRSGKSCRQ